LTKATPQEPIEDVKVGDKVLANDPGTGKTQAEPVVALIRHSGKHTMVKISLADGSMLNSTDGHPIWDATTGHFTDASKLRIGHKIQAESGALIPVIRLSAYSADLTAYNLQIDGIHTYYAGSTAVLVHNSCGPLTTAQATQMAARVGYKSTNHIVKGQRVFTNGKNFIVQDIDSYSGGLWKMAKTVSDLGSKRTRVGTYDYNLDYVGP
jgi:hypothetical protein